MLIDFKALTESVISNFYGGDKDTIARMFVDKMNIRIMYGKLEPRASIGFHKHENGSEIVYVLEDKGKFYLSALDETVKLPEERVKVNELGI